MNQTSIDFYYSFTSFQQQQQHNLTSKSLISICRLAVASSVCLCVISSGIESDDDDEDDFVVCFSALSSRLAMFLGSAALLPDIEYFVSGSIPTTTKEKEERSERKKSIISFFLLSIICLYGYELN